TSPRRPEAPAGPRVAWPTLRRMARRTTGRLDLGMFTPPTRSPAPAWVGAACLAVGCLVVLVAAGVVPAERSPTDGPSWLMGLCGAISGLPGAFLLQRALAARAAQAGAAARRAERPDAPWLWEHAWDREAAADDGGAQIVRGVAILAYLALFATPFHWLV